MTPLTISATALVLGLIVASFAVMGAPMFAIPLLLLLGAGATALYLSRGRSRTEASRHMAERRREAGLERAEPSEESRRTLTESAPPASGR
ncbi:MAG TPA: hypothetical protein VNT32_05030 [Thermoleophilaceae bacterium]|nr:hypothetical protein [Thermoleophilaceae bacterium]